MIRKRGFFGTVTLLLGRNNSASSYEVLMVGNVVLLKKLTKKVSSRRACNSVVSEYKLADYKIIISMLMKK